MKGTVSASQRRGATFDRSRWTGRTNPGSDDSGFAATGPRFEKHRREPVALNIRQIRPVDRHRLQEFHSRLSPATVHARFHAMKRELTEPLARRFTKQDGHDAVAVVATLEPGERIIGVARYCRIAPKRAEVAVVVEDAYQGRGIGTRLLGRLQTIALRNGIDTFVAEVLPDNVRMLRLLGSAGSCASRALDGELEVALHLSADPRSEARS